MWGAQLFFLRFRLSYQVLARKYRPQTFDQMIGQEHISQTLTNSLKSGRVHHAMLFTGLRGTGKTSSARILAKILRCTNLTEQLSPCNECSSCLEISRGTAVDVIEIDGASNNGVDNMRDLRDNVMFMPSSGKYKIFIIDEVHMLSNSAFNALLKTLEEPPAHVIFMMATTEVHKIPQTILSRCQRFDLRRIPHKVVAAHLKKICELENIQAEDKALWLIAKQGDGSARDSLSLMDQVINFTSGHLTETSVSEVLGLTDRSLILETFQHILLRDSTSIIQVIQKAHQSGVNPNLFFEELLQLLRHALLLKAAPQQDTLIDLPLEEIQFIQQLAQQQSDSDLHLLFDMTLKSSSDFLKASDPFLVFEVCLIRLTQAPRVQDLQKLFAGGNLTLPDTNSQAAPQLPKPNGLSSLNAEPQIKKEKPVAEVVKPLPTPESWLHFVHFVKERNAFLAAQLDNIIFALISDKQLVLEAAAQFSFLADQLNLADSQRNLQGFIDSFYGTGYTFKVQRAKVASGDSSVSLTQKKTKEIEEQVKQEILQDPRVQEAQKVFKAQAKIIAKE